MESSIKRKWVIGLTKLLVLSVLLTPYLPPVFLFLIGLITIFIYRGKWLVFQWPERVFFGFLVLSIISWMVHPTWYQITTEPVPVQKFPIGLIPVFLFGFYLLLSIWIKKVVNWTPIELKQLFIQFWLCGLYVVLIVILQQLDWIKWNDSLIRELLSFYKEYQWQSDTASRSVGTTGNSNLTAAILTCSALISIYVMSVLSKKWQKIASLAIFFLFCYSIYLTGSRGAWIGLVLGLLAKVWLLGYRKLTMGLFISLVGLVSLFPKMIPRSDTLMATLEARLKIWQVALDIFQDNWLLGTLPLHFGEIFREQTGKTIYHAHNILIGVATEFGIFGLILFIVLIAVTIVKAKRWRQFAQSKEEKSLAGILVSIIIALLGHGIYDYPLLTPQVGLIFMLSVIMIHAQVEHYEQADLTANNNPTTQITWRSKVTTYLTFIKNLWIKKES